MALTKEDLVTLESMVDRSTVRQIVEALVQICWEKREHVVSTWQDHALGARWAERATKLDKCAGRLKFDL